MRQLCLVLMSILIFVAEVQAAGQFNIGYGKIVHLRAYGDQTVNQQMYVQIDAQSVKQNSRDCMSQDLGHGQFIMFWINKEEKNLVPLVLAAYMAGKQVQIVSNDDPSKKQNGEVCRVLYIDVKD
jgi:hypothetical protein